MPTTLATRRADGELSIDHLQMKKAALVLRALNHPLRQHMLLLLHQRSESCVSGLYQTLQLEQSVASHHLAILRRASLVTTRRAGKQIFYSIDYASLDEVQAFAGALLSQCNY